MSTTHQDNRGGKPRQRGRKGDQRARKPDQQPGPKPDRPRDDQISAMAEPASAPAKVAAPVDAPLVGEVLPPNSPAVAAVSLADQYSIGVRAIVHAYGNYTMRSIEGSMTLFEKLLGVRTFDRAIEVQTEFAKRSYDDLVADTKHISGLYGELARLVLRPWERLVARLTEPRLRIF